MAGLRKIPTDLVGNVDYNWNENGILPESTLDTARTYSAGTVNTSPYAGYETGQTNFDNHLTVSVTHTFTPSLISQTRASYNRLTSIQPLQCTGRPDSLHEFQRRYFPRGPEHRISRGSTPGNAIPFGGPQNFGVLSHDVTKIVGRHSIRFGGQYTYIQDNRTFGAYEEAVEGLGTSTGQDLTNFLLGQVHIFQEAAVCPQGKFPGQTVTLPVGPPNFSRSNRYREGALYVQDSWKVTPRMTVNLGVRWEYFGVQHNKNASLDSNFIRGAGGITSPAGIAAGVVDTVPTVRIKPYGILNITIFRRESVLPMTSSAMAKPAFGAAMRLAMSVISAT